MTLRKPPAIEANEFKSAKWDEITAGRNFGESDIPTLELLCQWHLVAHQCIQDLDEFGELVFANSMKDLKPLPQLGILKQASGEIRQLNKQLGINDEAQSDQPKREVTVIHGIFQNRQSRAANKGRAKTG